MSLLLTGLSHQRIFDHVVLQLAQQGGPSRVKGASGAPIGCAYRGDGGRKCAVGFLLTDAEVKVIGNTTGVMGAAAARALPERLIPFVHDDFLSRLQMVHDTMGATESGRLRGSLIAIAEQYGLSKAVLYTAFPSKNAPEQPARVAPPVAEQGVISPLKWSYWWNRLREDAA